MVKDKIYRFIRMPINAEATMNERVNTALHAHESVVSMTWADDELVLLVETKVKGKHG